MLLFACWVMAHKLLFFPYNFCRRTLLKGRSKNPKSRNPSVSGHLSCNFGLSWVRIICGLLFYFLNVFFQKYNVLLSFTQGMMYFGLAKNPPTEDISHFVFKFSRARSMCLLLCADVRDTNYLSASFQFDILSTCFTTYFKIIVVSKVKLSQSQSTLVYTQARR